MLKGKFNNFVSLVTLFIAIVMLLSFAISSYAAVPKLIYLNGMHWDSAASVAARIKVIRTRPFDGMSIKSNSGKFMRPEATDTYTSMWNEFNITDANGVIFGQASFNGSTLTDNLCHVDNAYRPGDFFNDTAWNACAARMGNFALMAKNKGFKGLFLDTETYALSGYISLFQWPNTKTQYPSYTAEQYAVKARARGNQMMTAIKNNFPNAVVMFTFGPSHYGNIMDWASPTPNPLIADGDPNETANDIKAKSYKLQGAYFMGMLDARGTGNKIVDGDELYGCNSWYDFDYSQFKLPMYDYQTNYYASFPSLVFTNYPEIAYQGCSTDDCTNDVVNHVPETAANIQNQITWGLRRCDEYFWFYSQAHDWTITSGTNPSPPPSNIVTAVTNARNTAVTRTPGTVWCNYSFQTDIVGQNAYDWTVASGTWTVQNNTRNSVATKSYNQTSTGTGVTIINGSENPGGWKTWTNYDLTSWVKLDTTTTEMGICGRVKDANNFYLLELTTTGGVKKWDMYRKYNGTWTYLTGGNYNWSAGTWYMLKLSLHLRTLTAYISTNGTSFTTLGTIKDTNLTSGISGLYAKGANAQFDDVKVVCH